MAVTLAQYKAMTPPQRNKVTKPDLLALLDETVDETNILTKLDVIIAELKELRQKNEDQALEVKRVDNKVIEHGKVLAAHQKFMEDLDAEKRAKHMIVLGLAEEDGDGEREEGEDEREKFLGIVDAIGVQRNEVQIEYVERLGQRNEGQEQRNKPLKITFGHSSMHNKVLKNSYKLKDQPEGSVYKKVFLKKDQHPDVRLEEKRLYEVFKAERNKPENGDKEVVFNRKTRVVTVNGEEIDRFKLFSSFR